MAAKSKKAPSPAKAPEKAPEWSFLTNHAHVLICIARDPEVRLRDVATHVGITERAVQRIVSELGEAGYLAIERVGRRNRYRVQTDKSLRHALERHKTIGALVDLALKKR